MIRQLLIRLDTRLPDPKELTDWVALAQALDADLLAQLEEDEALSTLAGLPFSTEICRASATTRPLNTANLDRRTERNIRVLNQLLAEIARNQPLNWQVTRISHQSSVRPAADTALLQLRSGQPLFKAGVLAKSASQPHIAVIHNGDEASEHALESARRIASQLALPIVLLALPASPWHQTHGLPAGVAVRTDLAVPQREQLLPLLRAWQVSLLVLPASLLNEDESLPPVATLITP
ncbi:hypothetical protein [Marinobacterium lutimaris]|uniref:Universal stress protein family protein n=1 Tax=Marinobacterium lutimaris TaxID=568106 RepID=A0A1H6DKB3_9GAMM|nr:hypothetical protein [Marinobacterium lutimaris]SEG85760.1 hypothetical protein SAMN05444390_10735 [Marinobacterium lutimaris]